MIIVTDENGLKKVLHGVAEVYSVLFGNMIAKTMGKVVGNIIESDDNEISVYITSTCSYSSLSNRRGKVMKSLRVEKSKRVYTIRDL